MKAVAAMNIRMAPFIHGGKERRNITLTMSMVMG